MTASAIKQTVGKYTGFAARFGGDEFVIAWMPEEKNADTALIPKTVSSLLKESCREKGKPYELSVSWGCAVCTDPSVSAAAYIKEADAGLYEMKRKRQALR
jgi:diguanylate cyclase (GGDEF)-like protein